MNKSDALKYFGSTKAMSKMLGVTVHAIYQWPETLPALRQWEIALITNYKLMPDEALLPPGVSPDTFQGGAIIADERVSKLLSMANRLSHQGKGEVLDALLTMAYHHQ